MRSTNKESSSVSKCAVQDEAHNAWNQFVEYTRSRCSLSAFQNWISPIEYVEGNQEQITLKVPNVFVKEYLLTNFRKDLIAFLPVAHGGEPAISFIVEKQERKPKPVSLIQQAITIEEESHKAKVKFLLNFN